MTNVMTAAEYNVSMFSDVHKEAYGFRPHGRIEWFRSLTVEEQDKEIDRLSNVAHDEYNRELEITRKEIAEVKFNWNKIAAESNVSVGTVIRWALNETNLDYGMGSFSYELFGTINKATSEFEEYIKDHTQCA